MAQCYAICFIQTFANSVRHVHQYYSFSPLYTVPPYWRTNPLFNFYELLWLFLILCVNDIAINILTLIQMNKHFYRKDFENLNFWSFQYAKNFVRNNQRGHHTLA